MVKKKTQSRKKRIPQRTCVACREVRAKRELIRVVSPAEGIIDVDETGKRNGRGAYLCRKRVCWDRALKTGALSRALRVSFTPEHYAVLRAYAESLPDIDGPDRDATASV
jgi:predicted RNA-binding protein YlxR (DUF448 family)